MRRRVRSGTSVSGTALTSLRLPTFDEPIAVAYEPAGTLLVQVRHPPRLLFVGAQGLSSMQERFHEAAALAAGKFLTFDAAALARTEDVGRRRRLAAACVRRRAGRGWEREPVRRW